MTGVLSLRLLLASLSAFTAPHPQITAYLSLLDLHLLRTMLESRPVSPDPGDLCQEVGLQRGPARARREEWRGGALWTSYRLGQYL